MTLELNEVLSWALIDFESLDQALNVIIFFLRLLFRDSLNVSMIILDNFESFISQEFIQQELWKILNIFTSLSLENSLKNLEVIFLKVHMLDPYSQYFELKYR